MAVYEIARQLTENNEGGWCDTSGDAGGETYKGIARNFHPRLELWKWIDKAKDEMVAIHDGNAGGWVKKLNANLAQIPALQGAVDEFYRSSYWDANNLSLVQSQPVANWIYDHAVNAGSRGVKWAQEAAGVTADGRIGPATLAAINAMDPAAFLQRAEDVAAFYRLDKALAHPDQVKFLPSWLRRDGVSEEEIAQVMAMAKNGLTMDEVKILKGIIEEAA